MATKRHEKARKGLGDGELNLAQRPSADVAGRQEMPRLSQRRQNHWKAESFDMGDGFDRLLPPFNSLPNDSDTNDSAIPAPRIT